MNKDITFPVMDVRLVPITKIQANDYNPNRVASPEMNLLELSIIEDGFTQPLVCYYKEKESISWLMCFIGIVLLRKDST